MTLALLIGSLLLFPVARAGSALAATGDIGYEDQAYNGSGGAPTADKPQSKLWYNDGLWWADMFDTVSKTHHVFRLDRATQKWIDTGTQLDNRSSTRADLLWSGGHLYAASAVIASSSSSNVVGQAARLYRYSYNASSKSYALDAGFPVAINNVSSESLTLDRDSQGVLWATWTQNQQVFVNHTTGSDSSWATPAVLPVTGATGLDPDDISALAAFGNNRVGVMWSNQATSTFYFATHRDSDTSGTWTGQVALSSPGVADDHMNLKQLEGDDLGHLYAAVKTSADDAGAGPTAAQILLLALNPNSGNWSSYVYGTVADCHTRPMVVIDSTNRQLHMFATAPTSGCPYSGTAGTIFEKTSSLDSIAFPAGRGTPVMQDADSPNINNVTGTKQNVTAASGLVIMASNDATSRYWHADVPLSNSSPTVSFTASPDRGVAPLQVSFTDTSTGGLTAWSWTFGDGGTATAQNPTHTYTTPGSYTVKLTGTTASGSTASSTSVVTVDPAVGTGSSVTYGTSSFAAQSTANTTVSLTKPPQTAVGDFLVANFTADNKPTLTNVPAGWTALLPTPLKPGGASTLFAYYHVVTSADDTTSNWRWTLSAAQKWGGGISRYVGVDATHPLDTTVSTATDSTGTATTVTVPGIGTVTNGAMVIGGLGADGATPTVTPPAGFTEAWESGGGKTAEQANLGQATAGPTGSRTWTISAARSLSAWMTALRPSTTP